MRGRSIERLLLLCFLASCVDLEGSKPISVVVIRCPPPSPQDISLLFDAFQEITYGWGWKMLLPFPNELTYQPGSLSCNETWLATTIEEAVAGREVDAVVTSSPSRICPLAASIAPANTLFFTSACPEDLSPFGTSVALLATAEAVAHLTKRYSWRSVILLYS
ncbi:uncharacterized protein LOC120356502, partial [Nilaparvata lugens]|uniref:uncharacterized protein LOC120356502 n=1 Tax=Nilaparvata lugens TaxID=108931 RepID=UPI00193C89AB